jgi:hypothetical protein
VEFAGSGFALASVDAGLLLTSVEIAAVGSVEFDGVDSVEFDWVDTVVFEVFASTETVNFGTSIPESCVANPSWILASKELSKPPR